MISLAAIENYEVRFEIFTNRHHYGVVAFYTSKETALSDKIKNY
jgi:hypothetical protein